MLLRALFNPLHWLAAIALVGVSSVVGSAAYHHLTYQDRVFPGVRLHGTDLGGMSAEEVFVVAQALGNYYRSPSIRLSLGGQTFTYRPADFGVTLDPAETARHALEIGRTGDLFTQLQQRLIAWWQGVEAPLVVRMDEAEGRHTLQQLARQLERDPRDAQIVIEGSSAREVPAQAGLDLDETLTLQAVLAAARRAQPITLNVPHRALSPRVVSASEAAQALSTMLSGDLVLLSPRWDEQDRPLPPMEAFRVRAGDLRQFVLIEDETQGGQARLRSRLNRERLRGLLAPLGKSIARAPENARFSFDPKTQTLTPIFPGREGRTLDIEATLDAIERAVQTPGLHQVTLVVRTTPPSVPATATARELGITALITQATTFFKGSSAARLANVRLAASRFHGVVVPPGAVFSFNAIVGEISKEEGFEEGLIILGDRTVKGVGGGVCQVSTTAYQAALRAGFPVLERYPHGYRVSYYERGMGPGFDASVFSPWADLKFRNDLSSHLLIETEYDPVRVTLTFRFYGTPDGRQVLISPATITDIVPHGPDIYEPDPTNEVPPGKIKQVEFAANGATVSFTRQVLRDGQLVLNEQVVSRYVPWQNVFRFGAGFVPPQGAIVRASPTPPQP
ncbi:MAG: VanW family protein [Thermoflexales bacterium]|nr:VanW family protein [Thermoflexales bacterium]